MNQTLLNDLADVIARRKAIVIEEEAIKQAVLEEMQKAGVKSEETSYGTFSVSNRPKYTFTDKVTELDEKLKLRKIYEKEKGLAKEEPNYYLGFKPLTVK